MKAPTRWPMVRLSILVLAASAVGEADRTQAVGRLPTAPSRRLTSTCPSSDLAYRVSYNLPNGYAPGDTQDNTVTSVLLYPIAGFPATHPMVTGTVCGVSYFP